ncbi:hypothetical protein [Sphingosinicella terrae]|uniref:hypothetical protein n=1 Tax=Sphingosinicella terrae TaxID=2172047 RepID=UPI0013B37A6C|nr:hypothetical protein [Sphingosinicella terrae]
MAERRPARIVLRLMHNPITLPLIGGSLLAAVAVGIHLGESAIGMIKPVYFQGPALHPRDRGAAIEESRLAPRPAAYASLYGWDEGRAARAAECPDCDVQRPAETRVYSAAVPYFGGGGTATSSLPEPVEKEETQASPPPLEAEAPKRDLVRYAHYPVSAEDAEPALVEDAAHYGDVSYQQGDVWLIDGAREQR